jgi:glycosyltransferase involved in cell wall biosynthesis
LKTICILTSCFNELGNIRILHQRFATVFEKFPQYQFKLLIIDNNSTDGTRDEIERICQVDKRVQAIFNSRNFGHIRSPHHGFREAEGDAIFTIVSDLQVAPEIIEDFIPKWEAGADIVIGVRADNHADTFILRIFRTIYYYLVNNLSDIPLRKNFIGIGLYDKKVATALKQINDPYPYFRGMVFEVGYKIAEVTYNQEARVRGITKNNFLTLYDLAMLGICSHSKIPLRIATLTGFGAAFLSFLMGMFYLIYKLVYWDNFRMGIAPVIIGLFFLGSMQLIFLGIIGEYLGFVFTKVQNRPLVFEEKRINF